MTQDVENAEHSERVGTALFVLSLRERGVFDVAVLRALETVPRDLFAPSRFADLARADVALPLACGQTMTSPTVVAQMLVALSVQPSCRVLEIGTGSGWVTALLVRLGGFVTTYELRPILRDATQVRLERSGVAGSVEIKGQNGFGPMGADERFDRIILNGAVPYLPATLVDRLAPGGRLVGTLSGNGGSPRLLTIVRPDDGPLTEELGGAIRISPLVMPSEGPNGGRPDAGSTEV